MGSLNSQVSGKPSPAHFLINTKEKAKKSSDYVSNINNSGLVGTVIDGSHNFDYVNNIKNGPGASIHKVIDGSTNVDYVSNINNGPGASIHKVIDKSFNDYGVVCHYNPWGRCVYY